MLIVLLFVAVAAGAVAAWFWSRAASRGFYEGRLAEAEGGKKAEEARVVELRSQITQRDADISRLRTELDAQKQARVEAATRLAEAAKAFEEQKALIEAMKAEMTGTFNALSGAALKNSSEEFLRLAAERLGKVVAETQGGLGEHKAAMNGMIAPLADVLKRYEEQLRAVEERRGKEYGSLAEQIRSLASMSEGLQRETGNLVTALRRPEVRGRWGEMQLKRVAELSGMSAHCDFTEQVSVASEDGRLRPDMVVHLPAGREIVVDAKVSLDAYLDAVAASTEEDRKAKLAKHAQQLRAHMRRLSEKTGYWSQFKQSPEFVVLFVPGEVFFSAALEYDPAIIEDGMQKKVIIATPTTFIALLHAVAYGWRQEEVSKNAERISELGRELYERMGTMAEYLNSLGGAIAKVNDGYNRLVGSMEARVLPTIRKFPELGNRPIPVIEPIDKAPRELIVEKEKRQ
ncbi:MAG: DNA recombination protein RmuC [Deltaproteobacteria bacterium]|nr:DNA recombination protein RmuC [Deltaproteobacteria bacterium]